ncbi:hypothetical protein [Streptomyces sp. NPDC097619]|uniref:hypothetical protein n=1 Tax=Streptomyces sp. NPDC097619 TaxID=3157228 RepID=UPI003318C0BE
MSGPLTRPVPPPTPPHEQVPRPPQPVHPSGESADDVVRWAAFSCLLVPVVLVVYGTSYGGAAVATLGLVVVTAVCRVMLRHAEKNERAAARVLAERPGDRRRRRARPPHG